MPGTTMFMPVTDMTEEMINAIMLNADLGAYVADDRNGMRPCIDEKWIKEGWVDSPVPLSMLKPSPSFPMSAQKPPSSATTSCSPNRRWGWADGCSAG